VPLNPEKDIPMKLGTQTNSLTNHILSRAVIGQPTPVEGMGATILCWTDRHAATIIHVTYAHVTPVIYVREDKATVVAGDFYNPTYAYEPNPNGHLYTFRQRKDGSWQQVVVNEKTGRFNAVDGAGIRIGQREEYRDPSF
jgi:hypothetical protein